jgi:hypothetical protein
MLFGIIRYISSKNIKEVALERLSLGSISRRMR